MSDAVDFTLELEQVENFEFRVRFDAPGVDALLLDEPAPLGSGRGPNAARLVAAGVANCLSASLLFCLRTKFKQAPGPMRATVRGHVVRDEHGRFRIGGFDVAIHLTDVGDNLRHFDRCLAQFEDFCVVTESVRHGIPVRVAVVDGAGREVYASDGAARGTPATGA